MHYFLGADIGSTKTHTLIVDETGRALGFGESGPANHETVGYEGMFQSMHKGLEQALRGAGLSKADITGAGFGVAGFDWPSEYDMTTLTIDRLALNAKYKFVNDAVPGLVVGSEEGWGVVVVSGTGSNCRGWDREHKREGRVTGHGVLMGEGAGGTELMHRCMQLVGYAWSKRGPTTKLADAFIEHVGAKDLEDLIQGYTTSIFSLGAEVAPIVFRVAEQGDKVARDLIHWAGYELGEMANAVIRQLEFENLAFDVVMTGSMFEGGEMLIAPMRETIHKLAPKARFVRLTAPPVLGAVMLGMEAVGFEVTQTVRKTMIDSISSFRNLPIRQS
ncbi:MAG TPA: BadF/BadG/BcrA/BcrD ATPase family protein [Anaerolineales bacterium]|nr:BadF/BadG/BcrA/BcrD ATPase family protein [Anaerolineales bacterium]